MVGSKSFILEEVVDKEVKSNVTDSILRCLPNWFGIEQSIVDYVEEVRDLIYFMVSVEGKVVGFLALKNHNYDTSEICVMGILEEYHRLGIGKALVNESINYLKENNFTFLTVKTLDESRVDESYAKTREFYKALGFKPLEVFKTLWDAANPCLMLCMYLRN